MKRNENHPPRLAMRLLSWFLKPDLAEEVAGDLEEKFHLMLAQGYSPRQTRLNYWYQVINYLRPFAIKPSLFSFQNQTTIMLRHTFTLTYRNFLRHTGFFMINLASLTLGLTAAFLIFLWVQDELKVDHFHEHGDQLLQVMKNAKTPSGEILTFEWTPAPLGPALKEEFPEVRYAVTSFLEPERKKGIISYGDQKLKVLEQYASTDFFDAFSFALLEGQPQQVLADKSSVVISDELAIKLFGSSAGVSGKTLEWEQDDQKSIYTVSGVFKSPSVHATMQFDMVFPFQVFADQNPQINDWKYGGPDTYVVLNEGASLADFNEKISGLLQERSQEEYQYLFAVRYADQYLYNTFENGEQAGGRIAYVRLFSVIGLIILIIACINFMNLSTARASKRSKEIGVKKAFGVHKRELVVQYLMEAFYMVLLAMMISIALSYLLLPYFSEMTGKSLNINWNPGLILSLLLIVFLTSLLAGSYPAFYLSNIKIISVLKGKLEGLGGALFIRQGLVVLQFIVSAILMIMVFIVVQQIDYLQSKPLGYEKDNLITFKRDGALGNNLEVFLNEIEAIPGVKEASNFRNNLMLNEGTTTGVSWEGQQVDEQVVFKNIGANFNWLETMEVKLLEGRSFSAEYGDEETKVVFNQEAIDQMGIKDPIGKTLRVWGRNRQIIGVMDNFHFESLYEKVSPCFLLLNPKGENFLLRIKGGSEKAVISQLKEVYQKYNPGLPFEFEFVDEAYQKFYNAELRVAQLSKYASGLAILISCLGLLGLVIFTSELRKKEIGIRKVLGANFLQLTQLITKDFLVLVAIALIIATPIAYYVAKQWLDSFAYTISLNAWYFVLGGFAILLIAIITISLQTIRAAMANPIEVLRLD